MPSPPRTRCAGARLSTFLISALLLPLLALPSPSLGSRLDARQVVLNPKGTVRSLTIDSVAIDSIAAFGDSVTDSGNYYAASSKKFPVAPYFTGRFSNGPVYIEYMANMTGAHLVNFAYAGATTGPDSTAAVQNLPGAASIVVTELGLAGQVERYISSPNTIQNPGTIHLINIGLFDYLNYLSNVASGSGGAPDTDRITTNVVANITAAVTRLTTQGANTIVVLGLPDLSTLPFVNVVQKSSAAVGTLFTSSLSDIATKHNAKIQTSLSNYAKTVTPSSSTSGYRLKFVNMNSDPTVAAARSKFSTTAACLTSSKTDAVDLTGPYTACTDPDSRWYWDFLHPTTQAHSALADAILTQLNPAGPSTGSSTASGPASSSPASSTTKTGAADSRKTWNYGLWMGAGAGLWAAVQLLVSRYVS
ncbi:hypothetical protein M427DRAFT_130226 [Gonapodya prolifera JEL478]|uniref:Carbohydrate esterase family 16 protein n=1 Tax=Gonapodya prolifera (strain JEL478) TaxID=1344416 RepID=A0A139B0Q0_GONPJ|nr:hypothetical protein M427DRAFT_130226 [Gonapodya prolifera JEL478]|eukprot:KXS22576.1 hypothetical protein M427DRAFT_130226 [Gonapodya prolifera JEL478]